MSYILTKTEQLSMRDAYQENNAASVKLVKSKLKQMIRVIDNGIQIKLEPNNTLISSKTDFDKWARSYLGIDIKEFISK